MSSKYPIKKWCRSLHRHLSFFYVGVIIVYAVSGFLFNHKKDFNPNYTVTHQTSQAEGNFPMRRADFTQEYAISLLEPLGEQKAFTKLFFLNDTSAKIFLKGGSSVVVDITTGELLYEALKNRPVLYQMNKLHYNPNRLWTLFSDIFVLSLLVITVTGVVIVSGKRGLWGVGGIELLLGIIIPMLILYLG